MKNILIVLKLLFASCFSFAQITFEHYYPPVANSYLSYAIFYPCDVKYYQVNDTANTITVYNTDHSVYKNITIPAQPPQGYKPYRIYSLSNKIFDTDSSTIEYLFRGSDTNYYQYYTIYGETGTVLFSDSSIQPFLGSVDAELTSQKSILYTPTGVKLMLHYQNNSAKVFSLPGEFPKNCNLMLKVLNGDNEMEMSNPFPNPSSEFITIPYTLPEETSQGELIFSDLNGAEIRRYKVDKTFNSLLLNISDFATGMYFYQLSTFQGFSGTKKMIKIK